jgi:TolA-binding protein
MSDDLRELGKHLPWHRPDTERREAVRSSLLVAAAEGDRAPARRWVLIGGGFAAGALAAAAIAVVIVRTSPDPEPRQAHARVDAPPTAELEHTVTASSTGTDEIVRVRAGIVRVAVPEIRRGDRVRMKTGDAEVEGTGVYEVSVTADTLSRVTVASGTARVKVDGVQQAVFLSAGQTWRAAIETAELELPAPANEPAAATSGGTAASSSTIAAPGAPDPAAMTPTATPTESPKPAEPTPRPAVRETTRPPAPSEAVPAAPSNDTTPPGNDSAPTATSRMPAVTALELGEAKPAPAASDTERRFQAGYALLREGKVRQAAIELGAAADAGGDDPLAADARYFQAIALVRSNQKADAERVLIAFLDRAKQTMRRGRAAMLLGRLVADRGDTASAVSWFKSALEDPDPAIAAAARAGIEALEHR